MLVLSLPRPPDPMRPLRFARPLLLGFAFLLAACDSPSGGGGEAPIGWLRDNAVPFASVEPGGSFAELAPLGHMMGDARIVGLGEATHGSREFFRMKHRVVEYLVRERGFRTFAIEATWAEATRVNRYLHTGEGDPAVLLANLHFWTWNTREVLEMIQWMRAYNQSVPAADRVSFYGFDVQHSRSPWTTGGRVPPRRWTARRRIRRWRGTGATASSRTAFGAAPELRADGRVGEGAVPRRGAGGARADRAAGGRVRGPLGPPRVRARPCAPARVVVQNEDIRRGYPKQRPQARRVHGRERRVDRGGGRTRLAGGAVGAQRRTWRRLPRVHGHAPRAARSATTTWWRASRSSAAGSTPSRSAPGSAPCEAPDAVRGSYEHEFHRLGLARFYVDLRPVRAGGAPAARSGCRGPRPFRMIGATYREADPGEVYDDRSLAQEFDIMIHLTDVTPTELITTRPE